MNKVLHDLDGMPEWQKKREYLASLLTNLTFEVVDVLETLWVECEDANQACGYAMKDKYTHHFELAKKHIHIIRSATLGMDAGQQESFGRDAEILLDLIYAAVTRTGTDDTIVRGFLEHIMAQPDRVGLDGVRKGGEMIEEIKMRLAKERIETKIN